MERVRLEAVQWSTVPHIDDVDQISDEDFDVLKEVGDVLRKHGREEKFGLCLIHKHFDLSDGDRMFEETDHENELLISRVVRKGDTEIGDNVIQTMWRFPKGIQAATVCQQVCDYFLGHKSKHKKVGI